MKLKMDQHRGPHDNDDWLPGGLPTDGFGSAPTRHGTITLDIDPASGMIKFTMQHTPVDAKDENLTGSTDADGHFIFVPSGAYIAITIKLSANWNWWFDVDPLSFKKQGHAGNYRLYAMTRESITIWAKSTDAVAVPPSTGHAKSHGFNLYVRMAQTPAKAFPVRLDPDLKNPPPPQLTEQATGPVPLV